MKTNSELQNEVEEALVNEGHFRADEISVSAHNGIVTLGGEEDSYTPILKAQSITQKISGVDEVINNIYIRKSTVDAYEKHDIEFELSRILDAGDHKVGVNVEGNRVTLTGQVASQNQRDEAGRIARVTPGIYNVTNNIEVI